jgi:ABC-type dipeptide/oligopeptide/nickel transport system permease subunit
MRPPFIARLAQHRGGFMGGVVLATFLLAGVLASLIAPYDPLAANVSSRLQLPSSSHWLGTDALGRDILSRLLYGATVSMRVGLSVVLIGIAVGVPVGAISGYVGGIVDLVVQRVVDTVQAFPGILLLVLLVALVGPSLEIDTVALGVLSVPAFVRLVRAGVLQVRELSYVEAARVIGCRDFRVLTRYILPNALTPVLVQATLQAAQALLLLAGLSFLGLGAQPPTPEWGAMLAEGKIQMRAAPHVLLFPAMSVSIVVLGLNLLGDALRDALDPRTVYRKRG